MRQKKRSSGKNIGCPFCVKTKRIKPLFSHNNFNFFFCSFCQAGFIYPYPKPKEVVKYYHTNYWVTPGILGFLRRSVFSYFQKRRKKWLMNYLRSGSILDVGAGEGKFAKSFSHKFKVTSLDVPSSKIINSNVLKVDFLKWRTATKFDAIVFWESLEHTPRPEEYLRKAAKLLKDKGLIFIEYPQFECFESKLFNKHWFHLDPPRHHSYLTKKGLEIISARAGLYPVSHRGIPAFEYAIWGFIGSALDFLGLKMTDILKQNRSLALLLAISPFFLVVILIQILFVFTGQSPIWLMIAKKDLKKSVSRL